MPRNRAFHLACNPSEGDPKRVEIQRAVEETETAMASRTSWRHFPAAVIVLHGLGVSVMDQAMEQMGSCISDSREK